MINRLTAAELRVVYSRSPLNPYLLVPALGYGFWESMAFEDVSYEL